MTETNLKPPFSLLQITTRAGYVMVDGEEENDVCYVIRIHEL